MRQLSQRLAKHNPERVLISLKRLRRMGPDGPRALANMVADKLWHDVVAQRAAAADAVEVLTEAGRATWGDLVRRAIVQLCTDQKPLSFTNFNQALRHEMAAAQGLQELPVFPSCEGGRDE